MQYRSLLIIPLPVILLLTLTSCEKFSGDQKIPAYINIDSISLTTEYSVEGSASHNITDAWIYVDDELIGAFQMPARPPVLKSGIHRITVLPGIKKNGIAATRIKYDFYNHIISTMRLQEDSVTNLSIRNTTYTATSEFLWKEDFEGVSISLDTTGGSLARLEKTPSGSPMTFEGSHSALVILDSSHNFFECMSHNEYEIPFAPVFLELNFNCSNPLTIGVFLYGTSILYQVPILTLNVTNAIWKKIYIDLTTSLNAYSSVSSFRIYMGTYKTGDADQTDLLLDNIKLVTRKSTSE